MAALTDVEKRIIRNFLERKATDTQVPVSWVKAAVNDGAQAIEDLIVANAGAISSAIDAATTPHGVTFTAAEKKALVAKTLELKFVRDK